MGSTCIVDLCSDDELGEVDVKPFRLDPDLVRSTMQQKDNNKTQPAIINRGQDAEQNGSSTGHSSNSIIEQGQFSVDDIGVCSTSYTCPEPVCRQFWKAGSYKGSLESKVTFPNNKNYLHVHPMFLHSNATSHKWAFGAVAELLDNAVDEIQNGATFVTVDKTTNPRDESPALLIQDDGGGMDPKAIRACMSFGFSDKKQSSAIGKYGNGFKTSSMRLGADVIVFSRHGSDRTRPLTQSVGLLSYTFLTRTNHDRIVVPMVDYEYNASTGTFDVLHGGEHCTTNLSILLQWSPYSTEEQLLKQFHDIGSHGTKIIIYNLWFNDDKNLELDFDSDSKDIRIGGDIKKVDTVPAWKTVNEQHIANRFHYSLRAYLSILYLRLPETFRILLRGKAVKHHNVVDDLVHIEYILYKPQTGGKLEGEVITTIGFLKEAPCVTIHGFCVYHKNRLILPYWPVLSSTVFKGRGVVGALDAYFMEPTHNKQDFERTSLFQKLEQRLKEMVGEYWDIHCGLIGYQVHKRPRLQPSSRVLSNSTGQRGLNEPVVQNQGPTAVGRTKGGPARVEAEQLNRTPQGRPVQGLHVKNKVHGDLGDHERRQAGKSTNLVAQSNEQVIHLVQVNKRLRAKCFEYEKVEEELSAKLTQLREELGVVQCEYERLAAELQSLDVVKEEKGL